MQPGRPGVHRLVPPLVLLILAPPLAPRAAALDPDRRITQYTHDAWSSSSGAPAGTINAIAQTPDGYLWLGTSASGLVRFDGVRFARVRELEAVFPLAPEEIRSLHAAKDGTLWVGTPHGIARHRDGRFELVHEGRSKSVEQLSETADGTIVFAIENSGFGFVRGGQVELWPTGDAGNRALIAEPDGSVWLGTNQALRHFNADGRLRGTLLEGRVHALSRDQRGRTWVAMRQGLHRLLDGRLEAGPAELGMLSDPEITAMLEDRDGSFWVGTRGHGLRRLGTRGVDSLERRTGLTSDHVSALYEDREGSLWVGTARGLDRLRPGSFTPFGASEGLPNDFTSSILEARDGALWVFTDGGGLSRIRDGAVTTYTVRDGLASDFGGPLYEARDGALWIGHDRGLTRFENGRGRAFGGGEFDGHYVSAITEDARGLLLYLDQVGLRRLEAGRLTPYLLRDGTSPAIRMPFSMRVTGDGTLWLATVGGLLAIRDGMLRTVWTAPRSAVVTWVHEDADHVLWAGTWLGLLRVEEDRVTVFDREQGLFHRRIVAVVEDRQGHLWLNSPAGVYRVPKLELNEVAAGRRRTVTSESFGTDDGLRTVEGTDPAQPAAVAARDGRLWFLTRQGLVSVNPERLVRNPLPPPVVIERVVVDGHELAPSATLQVPASAQRIEFHYNGLSLLVPDRVRFRFRLEGYDADWIEGGPGRVAQYTNLPAGRLVFRVNACNNDGVWNPTGATVSLQVAQRWYRAWWFVLACGLGVAASAGGVHRARMLRLRSRERALEERVRERTAALRVEIAERERAQEALRTSEQRYELAVRGTNEGIWDWDLDAGRIYYSPLWGSILGIDAAALGHSPEAWFERVHAEDVARVRAKLLGYRGSLAVRYADEYRMRHADAGYRWIRSRGFSVRDAEGRCRRLVGAISDVTDERSYDPLTGLPNRALFLERLREALARGSEEPGFACAVVVLDLDRFKLVNDSLGHATGDALLVAVARRIEGSLRAGDLVARVGGNEFTLLVSPVANALEATQIASRVRAELARPFELGGVETFVAVTAGIAVSGLQAEPADLVRDAGTALHHAKAHGRGGLELFHEGMRARAVTTLELGNALRYAVERGELVMHYQPVIALADGRVQGFEALVRWNHPERGLVLPGDFIPLAEQMQIIDALGRFVRQAACEQLAAWRARAGGEGSPLWISVNVSGLEFARHEFARELRVLLRATRLPARALRLEITESVLMDSDERIATTLEDLRRLGLSLDIDDFGTGYSSLSYLQQLPVNALKIDRVFVARLGRHERDEAFVETILALARKLGLSVVAEGVETREQLAILRRLGCDAAQGYLFSRPVPVEEASALLARGQLISEPDALVGE